MPKQVRFTQLVNSFGRPHSATLWAGDPNNDPDFKKAIEDNRIVTIQNVNVGSKKGAGEIGFNRQGNPTYLIFPKPLSMQQGTKVVGLKFDQLDQPTVKDPVKVKEPQRNPKIERVKTVEVEASKSESAETPAVQERHIEKKKLKPKVEKQFTFTVTLQFTATVLRDVQVKATTASEAIAAAMKQSTKMAPKEPDWGTEALEVKKLK
jgi:hypothetical protein